MSKYLHELFANNAQWSHEIQQADPEFFTNLANLQTPEYLWIGCSDSRVPANQITGLKPGEVFVHRNVANVVVHTDLNCLSVMQYAIDVLKVKHIIVCGHYGCGGVKAALEGASHGLIDNWLRHIQDVVDRHRDMLDAIPDFKERWDALCELHVIEQVRNVTRTTLVREAWSRGQDLVVHSWIYGLDNGRIRNMNASISGEDDAEKVFREAVTQAGKRWIPADTSSTQ